jgi:hypothetical protein
MLGKCLASYDPTDGLIKNANAWWDVVPPDSNPADPATQYYLVIRQQISGQVTGPNHVGIITKDKYALVKGQALPVVDLKDPAKVYMVTGSIPALKSKFNTNLLWTGDVDGDGAIGTIDQGRWYDAYLAFKNTATPGYDAKADLNADGDIGTIDQGMWYDNYLVAPNYNQTLLNSYIPK